LKNCYRYTERLVDVIRDVYTEQPYVEHPLIVCRPVRTVGLLSFGSDRGLCGAYNSSLGNEIERFIRKNAARTVKLFVMGKVITRRLRRRGRHVDGIFPQPSSTERAAAIARISSFVTGSFEKGSLDEVYLLYAKLVSGLRQRPVVERLLPLVPDKGRGRAVQDATFEPAARILIARLLPEVVRQSVELAFLNSIAAENAARQTAMTRASENAGDMLRDLMQTYSRLRQENITEEIIELAGGAAVPEEGRRLLRQAYRQ